MANPTAAVWHRQSFDRFMQEALPRLLAERVPLDSCVDERTDRYTCTLHVALATRAGALKVDIANVPQPDEEGIFEIDGRQMVVPPIASHEALDEAAIQCVGEQLLAVVAERLGEAPADLTWDESLARAWLPIDVWVREFVLAQQSLEQTNWLARTEHLRMLRVPDAEASFHRAQLGYACPIQTPEGTNTGKVLRVARGAEIRDGRMVRVDERPEAALSFAASMVPFLEHNDPHRSLMGVNMMRQWLPVDDPEPALVRTGAEPDEPAFWCGRDLLTAYVCWGIDTHEDAIVVSESAAKRMNQTRPLEPGDKLANRHGAKGVVSRILPDAEMPHLPDGTPVELIYDWMGVPTRLNFGQQREALASRIARAEGKALTVPPFHAPSADELRARLQNVGLDSSGMDRLTDGPRGEPLDQPSLVGWIYWGKTHHLAADKSRASVGQPALQQGEGEYIQLRAVGAFELIREHYSTRATVREGFETLPTRIAAGETIEQASPPAPRFSQLIRRLRAAGFHAELADDRLAVRFAVPAGPTVALARPVPHPWVDDREVTELGAIEELPEYHPLVEANDRLRRALEQKAPPFMFDRALAQLRDRVHAYMNGLLRVDNPPLTAFGRRWGTNQLMQNVWVAFSGRSVIAPGTDLRIDQLGIPDQVAWTLYGPFVDRELGTGAAAARSGEAAATLDRLMAEKWVLLNRAPSYMPTAILAFHAVRIPDRVIRLPALACTLLSADFDGDQSGLFLPITAAGQAEAGERLSIAAHLRRDPSLVEWALPPHAALLGLARLSLREAGRAEIERLLGVRVEAPDGYVTQASLHHAAKRLLEQEGVDKTLDALDALTRLGFEQARRSGASISPFLGADLALPEPPRSDDPEAWQVYSGEIAARIASFKGFDEPDLGPQVLATLSGSRGSIQHLVALLGSRGASAGLDGKPFIFRHGLVDGLTPPELFTLASSTRRAIGEILASLGREGENLRESNAPQGFGVLARAMRADRPGIVFARAALTGETDPLTDLDSRLFVGLPVTTGA